MYLSPGLEQAGDLWLVYLSAGLEQAGDIWLVYLSPGLEQDGDIWLQLRVSIIPVQQFHSSSRYLTHPAASVSVVE